jgi:hypothetical protein
VHAPKPAWLLAVALAALLLAQLAGAQVAPPRAMLGAHLHSKFLNPDSGLTVPQLADRVASTGLEVVPFGAPLTHPQHTTLVRGFLASLGERPAVVQLDTSKVLPLFPTDDEVRAVFAPYAFLGSHANVRLVTGFNEPLSASKGWATAAQAEARVRQEYRVWHQVSHLPFCHKFTHPVINVQSLSFTTMQGLWSTGQDAVCYDFYPDPARGRDPWNLTDSLRAWADQRAKPVHILETAIPDADPVLLRNMTERVVTVHGSDSVSVYHLLTTCGAGGTCPGGQDPGMAGWWFRNGPWELKPPGTMLREVLAPACLEPARDVACAPAPSAG